MTNSKNDSAVPAQPAAEEVVRRPGWRHLRRTLRPEPISRQAQRLAAAILEVLAGVRTPAEAASALGMGVPRYYLWEQRALAALVTGCEPRPPGQTISLRHQVATLQREVARLKQEGARQQALVRATQRSIGLTLPVTKPKEKPGEKAAGKGKRRKPAPRRPVVRALKAVETLRAMPVVEESAAADCSGSTMTNVVQRCVEDGPPRAAVPAHVAPAAGI
jgi:hypothetical protein